MAHNEWARTGRPATRAPLGMISTPHYLASQAGLRALHRGGSAVDAVIAANAVLCVAYPHMAGLGGDGFWLIHKSGGHVEAIDAAGPAAQDATISFYREQGMDAIPSRGASAALTVPGAVDGWRLAHERHGRLEWSSLFEDAIRYARDGLPVSRSLADWMVKDENDLNEEPRSAKLFLQDGKARTEGQRLVLAPLAMTFETIARDGPRAFYEGSIAHEVCAAIGPEGSPLRAQDFSGYKAQWVEPIKATYKGHEIYEFPPPTQGFAALQVFKLVEKMDVASWGDRSADYFHHMAEAVKVAFADRDEWLTDPDFVDIPLDRLLADDYLEERRRLIKPDTAMEMEKVEPGIAFSEDARKRGARAEEQRTPRSAKQGTEARSRRVGETAGPTPGPRDPQEVHAGTKGMGDTVYMTAVDEDGLAVSCIQSIYHDFGSAVVGGDTGIIMQNRGSHFSLDEHVANRLEPGKRTFHTLTPGMALKDGRLKMCFGTMGGEGQPQTHAALLTRILDFGHDVQQAIEAPRWLMGRTWGVQSKDLSLEGRIPDDVVRELRHRGQPVKMLEDWNDNMGHAAAILVRDDGFLEGGADPRGDGAALGY